MLFREGGGERKTNMGRAWHRTNSRHFSTRAGLPTKLTTEFSQQGSLSEAPCSAVGEWGSGKVEGAGARWGGRAREL